MKKRNFFRGFSLVEVMIALAILAMAISSLLVIRNHAHQEAINTVELRKMRSLLEQQMGKITAGLEKRSSGDFSESGYPGYRWHMTIKAAEPVSARDAKGQAHQIHMQQVTLVVKGRKQEEMSISAYFPTPEGK